MTYNPFTWFLAALALVVVGVALLVQGSELLGLLLLVVGGFALGLGLARRRVLSASAGDGDGELADDEPTLRH